MQIRGTCLGNLWRWGFKVFATLLIPFVTLSSSPCVRICFNQKRLILLCAYHAKAEVYLPIKSTQWRKLHTWKRSKTGNAGADSLEFSMAFCHLPGNFSPFLPVYQRGFVRNTKCLPPENTHLNTPHRVKGKHSKIILFSITLDNWTPFFTCEIQSSRTNCMFSVIFLFCLKTTLSKSDYKTSIEEQGGIANEKTRDVKIIQTDCNLLSLNLQEIARVVWYPTHQYLQFMTKNSSKCPDPSCTPILSLFFIILPRGNKSWFVLVVLVLFFGRARLFKTRKNVV